MSAPHPIPLVDAANELEKAVAALCEEFAKRGVMGQKIAVRAASCATDLVGAALILHDIELRAAQYVTQREREAFVDHFTFTEMPSPEEGLRMALESPAMRPLTPEEIPDVAERHNDARRLAVAVKSALFFLRALHDTLACAVRLADGETAGENTSMTDVRKSGKSKTFQAMTAAIENYVPWFDRMLELRNNAKKGVTYDIVGPAHMLGVVPQTVRYDDAGGAHVESNVLDAIRIMEITRGIWLSEGAAAFLKDRLYDRRTGPKA